MLALFEGESGLADTWSFVEAQLEFGLWTWDVDSSSGDWSHGLYGREMQWSWGLYKLLGLEPGLKPGSLPLLDSLTHPDDRLQPDEVEANVYSRARLEREFRIVRAHGIMRRIEMRGESLRNEKGVVTKSIGIARDVTERHVAALALLEAQQKFKALVGILDHPVRISRKDGGVVDIFGWDKVTGQKVVDSLGTGWTELIHPEDLERTRNAWQESALRGEPYEAEHRILCADKEYRWYKSKALAPFGVGGPPEWRIGVSIDIHDRKLAELSEQERLTGAQLRGARGILNWSVRDFAQACGMSPATVRRLEEGDGPVQISAVHAERVKEALSRAGVRLIFPTIGKPGVTPM
jgi:PAS domain S-box-containing protein